MTFGLAGPGGAQERAGSAAATVAGQEITTAELDAVAAERLSRIRNEEYQIRRQVLEALISRRLLEREAAARNMAVPDLEKLEIESKVTPVTEDQRRAVLEAAPERYQSVPEAQALAQIEANLNRTRLAAARQKLMEGLRAKYGVTIFLEPPRVTIDVAGSPSKGPTDATVTIVEFSDFQCPYCSRATPTLKQLQERYKGKLRIVFRDFPLDIHKEAFKAAEAGQCAAEQGKFWEMHDRMFQAQNRLQLEALKATASEVGLDAKAFAACLDSGRQREKVRAALAQGQRYGVTGTPAFFINGRFLSGAQSLDRFVEIVEDELARVAAVGDGKAQVR